MNKHQLYFPQTNIILVKCKVINMHIRTAGKYGCDCTEITKVDRS